MKPDAIGGSGEHALVRFDYARLTRGKPRGIHPAIYRTALPMREGSLAEIAGEVHEHGMAVIV